MPTKPHLICCWPISASSESRPLSRLCQSCSRCCGATHQNGSTIIQSVFISPRASALLSFVIVYCKIMTMSSPWIRSVSNVSDIDVRISLSGVGIFVVLALLVGYATKSTQYVAELSPYLKFAYNNFVKPQGWQTGDGQQSALESFYAAQVGLG